jgi:LysR family transcriptional regulator, transcriptional activator of the cysJI operon
LEPKHRETRYDTLRQLEVFLAVSREKSFSLAAKRIHSTPGLYVLPRIVAAFRTKYPGVEVKLQIANSRVIEERVRERVLDLGVVGGHAIRPGEECLTSGMRDELVLIVSPEHAWARRRDLPPNSLAGQPLLMREEGSATRGVTERALQRARVKFQVAMELD